MEKNHCFNNSRCFSHFAALRHILSCQDSGVAIHQAQPETTRQQTGMSLEHSRQMCLVHQQTGTAHHAQQTDLTNRLHLTCSTNREKTKKGRLADGIRQRNKKKKPQQTSVMKKLDYNSRFVRVIPTLSPNQSSHNSIGQLRTSCSNSSLSPSSKIGTFSMKLCSFFTGE